MSRRRVIGSSNGSGSAASRPTIPLTRITFTRGRMPRSPLPASASIGGRTATTPGWRGGTGPRQGRALEIGCGLGHLLAWLTDRYQVVGTDVNPWALEEARRNVPQGQFCQLSAEDMRPWRTALSRS